MKTNEKKELHSKTIIELKKKLVDSHSELFTNRLSHTRGKLKNPRVITVLKRNIAQIESILRGKELANEQDA